MPVPPFRLLLLDAAAHAALLADGPGGEILAELPLPPGFIPVDLAIDPGRARAFVALASPGGGALCAISLVAPALERLPVLLPAPARLAIAGDGRALCLADQAGELYALDLATLTLAAWSKPPGAGVCVGLVAGPQGLCGAWEEEKGGLTAAYSPSGQLTRLTPLGGAPTGLAAAPQGRLLVPFAPGPFSGEGLAILGPSEVPPVVITLRCPRCAAALPAYPIHAAVAAAGRTAYLVCEDSTGIVVVDLDAGEACGFIPLGRSVSRLALVPGDRFAVAASNPNADLCLIDLVNRRPLAFTACEREFLSPLAVID